MTPTGGVTKTVLVSHRESVLLKFAQRDTSRVYCVTGTSKLFPKPVDAGACHESLIAESDGFMPTTCADEALTEPKGKVSQRSWCVQLELIPATFSADTLKLIHSPPKIS